MGQKRAKNGDRVKVLNYNGNSEGVIVRRKGSIYQIDLTNGLTKWLSREEFKTIEKCSVEELITHDSAHVREMAQNKLGEPKKVVTVVKVGDEVYVPEKKTEWSGGIGIVLYIYTPEENSPKELKVAITNTNIGLNRCDVQYIRTPSFKDLTQHQDKKVRELGLRLSKERL